MPQIDFVSTDFQGQLPMYKWGDFDDLESKIRLYLSDSAKRQEVQGYTHVVAARDHTYVNRIQEMLSEI